MQPFARRVTRYWKNLLTGAVTLLLLGPLPAFATLTWGTWNTSAPAIESNGTVVSSSVITPWTAVSGGDYINIYPVSGTNTTGLPITFTFSSTVSQSGVLAGSLPPVVDTTVATATNVTVLTPATAGTFTAQVTTATTPPVLRGYSIYSNQFSSSTVVGGPVVLANFSSSSVNYTFSVIFTFGPGSSWTVPTSPSPFKVSFTDE